MYSAPAAQHARSALAAHPHAFIVGHAPHPTCQHGPFPPRHVRMSSLQWLCRAPATSGGSRQQMQVATGRARTQAWPCSAHRASRLGEGAARLSRPHARLLGCRLPLVDAVSPPLSLTPKLLCSTLPKGLSGVRVTCGTAAACGARALRRTRCAAVCARALRRTVRRTLRRRVRACPPCDCPGKGAAQRRLIGSSCSRRVSAVGSVRPPPPPRGEPRRRRAACAWAAPCASRPRARRAATRPPWSWRRAWDA